MIIIVGLGNPGRKYKNTRHNVGYFVIDHLVKLYKISPHLKFKLHSKIYSLRLNKEKRAILVRPLVFINSAGVAIGKLVDYFKIPRECIWVIHDEAHLPLGRIRINRSRSPGGHKGVQSIVENLKSGDFVRFRIGTGWNEREENQEILEEWVVKPFSKKEKAVLEKVIPKVSEAVILALKEGLTKAENEFNKKKLV